MAKKRLKATLPRAAGSREAAPSEPGLPSTRGFRVLGWKPVFGLLGRNAAERAKKIGGQTKYIQQQKDDF